MAEIREEIDLRTSKPSSKGPTNSILGKFYCRISLGKYSRPRPFSDSVFKPTSKIYLPLPDILRDTSSIKYNNTDTQTVGDLFNGDPITGLAGFAYRNAGRVGSDVIGAAVGSAAGALAKSDFAEAFGENLANEMIPADQLQTAIEQSVGKASNPNPSISFAGPSLRSFNLNWTFYPTSKDESDRIFDIIKLLKKAALPSNTFSNSGAILNYPYMCQLNFFPWDAEGDYTGKGVTRWGWGPNSILRYKKCVMNSVDVDYNPSNVPGFFKENDAPVAIRVSIGFDEIEYMLSGDWDGPSGSTIIEDTILGAFLGALGFPIIAAVTTTVGAAQYFTGDPKKDPKP